MARDLRADGLARQWFFVRYDDGGYHVRVRVRAKRAGDVATVTKALHDLACALRNEGLVTLARLEPYVPEVRRYGGSAALAAAESLFCVDSDSIAEYLEHGRSEVQRLTMATRTIVAWWRHDTCPRADLYPAMRAAQRVLWPAERWPGKGVGGVWRAYRAEVTAGLKAAEEPPHGAAEISALIRQADGNEVSEIIASVVHMHCNRLFACDNRRMEALAYEFALREMMRRDAVSK